MVTIEEKVIKNISLVIDREKAYGEGMKKISQNWKINSPINDKKWLHNEYVINSNSASSIARKLGLTCTTVTARLKYFKIPLKKYDGKGSKNPRWKGGRRVARGGYIYVYAPHHPFKNKNNCIFEHRLIMEEHLGRFLLPTEFIHHKNKIKNDNNIENLELISSAEHMSLHSKENVIHRKRDKLGRFV